MRRVNLLGALCVAVAAAVTTANASAQTDPVRYFIGVDNLSTISAGTYTGLDNPNYGHLTVLFAHWDAAHYHSKAILTYTGDNLGASTAVTRSASDYFPEYSHGTPHDPIVLTPGSELFAGKLVSNPYPGTEPLYAGDPYYYSQLKHGMTDLLAGFASGTPEFDMYHSSGDRWSSPAGDSHLHLEIVSLTPGLNMGDLDTLSVGGVGDEVHLTDPGDLLDFTPVFWTDANAAPGTYEAVVRFFDERDPGVAFGDSGDIRFLMQVVPEPASLALLALAAPAASLIRRKRNRA